MREEAESVLHEPVQQHRHGAVDEGEVAIMSICMGHCFNERNLYATPNCVFEWQVLSRNVLYGKVRFDKHPLENDVPLDLACKKRNNYCQKALHRGLVAMVMC